MIVTCQECDSSFNIDDSVIKDTGSKVKCSKCEHVFVVYPSSLADEAGLDDPLAGFDEEVEELGFPEEDETDSEDLGLPELDSIFGEEDDSGFEEIPSDRSDELDLDLAGDDEDQDQFAELEESDDSDLPDLEDIMDFDEETETAAVSPDADDELELDLDEDFDSDTEPESDDLAFDTDEDELDLLDAENLLDDDEFSPAGVDADQDSDEFEMDVDLTDMDTDSDDFATESEAEAESDQLDLDTDFDLEETSEFDDDTEAAVDDLDLDLESDDDFAGSTAEAEQSDELDLSDLEDLIDADEVPESALSVEASDDGLDLEFDEDDDSAEPVPEAEDLDDLDLEDLDLDLESDLEPEPADDVTAAADDLDLDFDLEDESGQPVAEAEEADELDLGDLEDILEPEDTPASEELVADTLDTEDISEQAELDLDLEFDGDDEAQPAMAEATADIADELDFSDLGKMLADDEEPVSEATADESPEDLELDFDVDLEPDAAAEEQAAPADRPTGGDDEFLDIEKMLEESDEAATDVAADELDLDLDLEGGLDEATADELDLDFEGELQAEDIQDISASVEDDLEFNLLESDEAALQEGVADLESSEVARAGAVTDGLSETTDDFDTDEFTDTGGLHGEAELIDDDVALPVAPRPKRSLLRPVLFFAVFLILVAAVLILPKNLGIKIPFLSDIEVPYISDVKIPYLYDKFNPGAKDVVGNLRITPLGKSITYEFVDNPQTGTLFVIRGRIKNEYDHPRSYIRVTGKLFQKGNKLAKKATVFGGNLLTEKELASLKMSAINKRLQNRSGDKKANINIRTGGVVPFMVVFDKLPQNLDEYTIEVAGSKS